MNSMILIKEKDYPTLTAEWKIGIDGMQLITFTHEFQSDGSRKNYNHLVPKGRHATNQVDLLEEFKRYCRMQMNDFD